MSVQGLTIQETLESVPGNGQPGVTGATGPTGEAGATGLLDRLVQPDRPGCLECRGQPDQQVPWVLRDQ